MSLMGTLAKVAIGIAVAKGAQSMLKGRSQSAGSGSTTGGLGDLMESLGGNSNQPASSSNGGGLDDLLGQVLGQGKGSQGGGLGDLLGNLAGQGGSSSSGGLGDLLEQFTGGKTGGGLGDLLGSLAGNQQSGQGSFGDVLNSSLDKGGEPEIKPTPQQEILAALLLRATIQAAKSDGELDHAERDRILKMLDDVSDEERRFVQNEMQQPVDPKALARQVPRGLEAQVYTISLMAIDLDKQAEAQYLHQLASAMGIGHQQVNNIHDELGIQRIYS